MIKQKAPRFVTVAVLTTITIIFYVFFNLYQVLSKKSEINIPASILEPLNPTLDTATLNSIQSRLYFEEGQVQALP
jgi:hypothetical protein